MKKKILFCLCLSFLTALSFSAQTKTVTNSDLTKFRSQRLSAEKELRENYAKLGFPSPEELQKRLEINRVETEKLSAKLRAERLERERIAAEIWLMSQASGYYSGGDGYEYYQPQFSGYYGGFLSGGYYNKYGTKRFQRRGVQSWRGNAAGIIYEPGSRPASIWAPRRITRSR